MNTTLQTTPESVSSTSNKPLWAAVGVLGVAVAALGAVLVHTQTKPADPPVAAVTAPADMAPAAPAVANAQTPKAPVVATEAAPRPVARKPAPVAHGTPSNDTVATSSPSYAGQPVAHAPARAACANCGTVEAVTPVQRAGATNGTGAVAGGVLGAIVGNQIGHGSGRAAATILGAVGGGYAGNAIEKQVKKDTVFQVRVRMEDGSIRTLEQAVAPAVGAQVVVDGNTLRANNEPQPTQAPAVRPTASPVYTGT